MACRCIVDFPCAGHRDRQCKNYQVAQAASL